MYSGCSLTYSSRLTHYLRREEATNLLAESDSPVAESRNKAAETNTLTDMSTSAARRYTTEVLKIPPNINQGPNVALASNKRQGCLNPKLSKASLLNVCGPKHLWNPPRWQRAVSLPVTGSSQRLDKLVSTEDLYYSFKNNLFRNTRN